MPTQGLFCVCKYVYLHVHNCVDVRLYLFMKFSHTLFSRRQLNYIIICLSASLFSWRLSLGKHTGFFDFNFADVPLCGPVIFELDRQPV